MTDELPKLVRDRIPEIIEEDRVHPVTETVSDSELEDYLGEKLVEEAEEFQESRDLEELADVLEVVYRWMEKEGVDREDLEEIRKKKKEERGGFQENIVLRDMED